MEPISLESWWNRIFIHTYYLHQYKKIKEPEDHWNSWLHRIQEDGVLSISIEWNAKDTMHIKALLLYNPSYILDDYYIRSCIHILYKDCSVYNVLKLSYYQAMFLASDATVEEHRELFYRLSMEKIYTYINIR
jgi:hypothetical protein